MPADPLDLKALREIVGKMTLPLCVECMSSAIRHVARNCDIFGECGTKPECNTPGRYGGGTLASLVNAAPALLAAAEERDALRAWLREAAAFIESCAAHPHEVPIGAMRNEASDIRRFLGEKP